MALVQQPYEISAVSGIEHTEGITLECTVYPNPTNDYIKLKVQNFEHSTLYIQLYNQSGMIIENKKVTDSESTIIEMGNLVKSTYLLKIIDNNKEVKTFKIIKN